MTAIVKLQVFRMTAKNCLALSNDTVISLRSNLRVKFSKQSTFLTQLSIKLAMKRRFNNLLDSGHCDAILLFLRQWMVRGFESDFRALA